MRLHQDIISVFGNKIIENDIMLTENRSVSLSTFAAMFPVELTYNSLINHDPEDKKGYRWFFDKCKAEGILN